MHRALLEYFGCPGELAPVIAQADLSTEAGYFAFGDAVGYGRHRGRGPVANAAAALPDLTGDAQLTDCGVALPFDVDEVVYNLRHERYAQNGVHRVDRITGGLAARNAYYFLRPVLPVAVRKHLQKIRLSGWRKIAFPRWPVDVSVDTIMRRTLRLVLQRGKLDRVPFVWFWPDGAASCAILTHDVEDNAGRDFCAALMDIDDEFGLKSSFQIVPEIRYEQSRALCATIRGRGFEVNVHDLNHDGHLFHSREKFLDRVDQINEYGRAFGSRGFRAAAMYREQTWFDRLQFSYDMSVPNVAHLEPQRGGCCTVMPYFIGNLVELPLTTIQDYSLFHILDDYSMAIWRAQLDLIRRHNGLITLLTHPDYLIEPRARSVYRQLLEHVARLRADRQVWFALPGEVDTWWRSRRDMTLVRSGGSWRVEGPDSERARVAYARLDGERLIFEVDR
jgi:hypothetical protein